jgi:predicted ATP-dependent endonuclease of OLD family
MKFMEKLNLTLYLLADDRTVHVTSAARQIPRYMSPMVAEEEVQSAISSEEPRRWEVIRPDPEQISIRLLEDSIRRLNRWVRNRVMQGSRRGDSDVNVIFSDIIEKFAKSVSSGRRRRATKREDLVNRINAIEQRNREYSSHGLTSPFNGQKLLYAINKASSNKFKSITPIISPYLDGLEARLQALSEIKETVEQLLKTINAFMTNKEVSFNISRARGFQIRSSTREELEPRMLSSGERHLLLLFCNTVTALDTQSIFIIDEPEISLNVKWQRNLINSLLACAKWGRVQYIFASHSVEILSQHMDKVVKLQKI